jgi:outer membrane protein OmpA-like peptidoglycan-associated protein
MNRQRILLLSALGFAGCAAPQTPSPGAIEYGRPNGAVATIPHEPAVAGGIPIETPPAPSTPPTTQPRPALPPTDPPATSTATTSTPNPPPTPTTLPGSSCGERRIDGTGFEPDSWLLPAAVIEMIPSVMADLEATGFTRLHVIGHADNRPSPVGNEELARHRAQAVADELIRSGIGPDLITVESQGDRQPAIETDTQEAWAANRRVVIVALCQK